MRFDNSEMLEIVGITVKEAIFSRYFVNTYPSSVQAAFKGAIDSHTWLTEAISRQNAMSQYLRLSAAWI